jgi:hypothetical protein
MGVVDGPSTPEGPPRSPLGEPKIKHFFTEETLTPLKYKCYWQRKESGKSGSPQLMLHMRNHCASECLAEAAGVIPDGLMLRVPTKIASGSIPIRS